MQPTEERGREGRGGEGEGREGRGGEEGRGREGRGKGKRGEGKGGGRNEVEQYVTHVKVSVTNYITTLLCT